MALKTNWQEANRILLAWGPRELLVSPVDRASRRGSSCKHPRKDGYACQRQVGFTTPDCCARHDDFLFVRLRGTARANDAAYRLAEYVEREMGVYFVIGGGLIKIGRATDVLQRLNDLRNSSPVGLRLHRTFRTWRGVELETSLHKHFKQARRHGEWFDAAAVLSVIDQLSDEEIHARFLPPMRRPCVRGTARDLARWAGTMNGRRVLQFVPDYIDVETVV